ncbi:reprolysin-like metallopeptidase [Tautonia rosea]|uniref:reprolysin-like metallopeptidase n=1 Tax=Tautonia rosea TaxID=2728037 RepID=UPI001473EE80
MSDVSFSVNECIFGWTAAYNRTDERVTLRIRLVPQYPISNEALNQLKQTWRNGIIAKWSQKHTCPPNLNKIQVDVAWVESGEHHIVNVHRGPRTSNMNNWDDQDDGNTVAHEAGHMFGNPDEYTDSRCPARSPVNTGNVMDKRTGPTEGRLYNDICSRPSAVSSPYHQEVVAQLTEIKGDLRRIVLNISGGMPEEHCNSNIVIDKALGTVEISQMDKLDKTRNVVLTAKHSFPFERITLTASKPRVFDNGSTNFIPDSLVASLTLETDIGKWTTHYAVEQVSTVRLPGPLGNLYSVTPSTSSIFIMQLHYLVITETAHVLIREGRH